MTNRRGLGGAMLGQGRGSNVAAHLPALAVTPEGGGEPLAELPLGAIDRSPHQPRTTFDPDRLRELADSMTGPAGVLQPIVVRPRPGGRWELLAGERRLEAGKLGGLRSIPARIRDVDDLTAATIALTENLAREDLNAWDEARGLAALRDTLAAAKRPHTVRDLARLVGRSKTAVGLSLKTADGLPRGVVESVPNWDKVPASALQTAAAAETPAEKRRILRAAIGRDLAERTTTARGVAGQPAGAPPFALALKDDGRLRLDLRRAPNGLTPGQAREILAALRPLVRTLEARARTTRPNRGPTK